MQQNTCLNCGESISEGERFCSNKCLKKYDNVKANKVTLTDTDLPQAIVDDVSIYAEAENLKWKEALHDLLLFAIKIRLPQLNLKPVAPKVSSTKSVLEKELESIELDLDLGDL